MSRTPAPWSVYLRKKREGACEAGLWIYNPNTKQTICDSGAPNEWPLSDGDRLLIEAAPAMFKALSTILVLIQQGVDDNDLECIEEECRDALSRVYDVSPDKVWTPDLDEFQTKAEETEA